MKDTPDKLLPSLVRSLVLFLCISGGTAAFGQEFVADDPLRFDVLPPGGSRGAYSFVIRSTRGRLTLKTLRFREIKGPDGLSLPDDSVGVSKASDLVNEDGTRITLTPKPDALVRPGEYRLALSVEGLNGKGAPVRRTLTVLLNRKAAEINLESLKDQTLELTRYCPWAAASGSYALRVRETTGKSPVADLTAEAEPAYTEKGRVLSRGKVAAHAAREPRRGETDSADAAAANAGQQGPTPPPGTADASPWVIQVELSGFDRSGAYASQLAVNSTSFEGVKSIPIKIVVKDYWLIPLLVIFLGVIGSHLLNRIAQDWQPRQRNRQKLARLRIEADKLLRLVKKPDKVIRLQTAINSLRDAEITNEQGDWASAKAQLEEPAKVLDEARARETVEQAAAFETMNGLLAAVESYRSSNLDLTGEERGALAAIAGGVTARRVEMLLANGHVDEAGEQLAAVVKEFEQFKRARLEKDLEGLERSLPLPEDLPASLKPERLHIAGLMRAAKKIIGEGDSAEARAALEEIAAEIGKLKTRLPKGLMEGAPRSARVRLLPGDGEGRAADILRITVLEPTARWTTAAPLTFVIEGPDGLLRQGDKFRWYFGAAGPVPSNEARAEYRFDVPGSYEVRAEILRGDDPQPWRRLTRPVNIRRSEAEVELDNITSRFRRSERVIIVAASILATLSGLMFLYAEKPFGSLPDYLLALFWGFGIDSSVRGFAGVLTTVSRQ